MVHFRTRGREHDQVFLPGQYALTLEGGQVIPIVRVQAPLVRGRDTRFWVISGWRPTLLENVVAQIVDKQGQPVRPSGYLYGECATWQGDQYLLRHDHSGCLDLAKLCAEVDRA